MATLASLVVNLTAETAQFRSELARSARTTQTHFQAIEKSARQMRNTFLTVFGAIGIAQVTRSVVHLADEMINLNNRLKIVTTSATQHERAMSELARISDQYGSTLSGNAQLFTRLAQGQKLSAEQMERNLTVTEALSASLKISGATANEAASASLQLAQALGTGRFQGEEFRAVFEAAPVFMSALSDALGVSTAKLYEMREAGQLTTELVIDAMIKKLPELTAKAAEIGPTFATASTRVRNNMGLMLLAFEEGTGVFQSIVGVIDSFADMLRATAQKMPEFTAAWRDALRIFQSATGTAFSAVGNIIDSGLEAMSRSMQSSWTAIIATIPNSLSAIIVTVGNFIAAIIITLDNGWAQVQNYARIAWNTMDIIISNAVAQIEEDIVNGFREIFAALGAEVAKAGASLHTIANAAGSVSETLGTSISNTSIAMQKFGASFTEAEPHVSSLRASVAGLADQNLMLADGIKHNTAIYNDSIQALKDQTQAAWDSVTANQQRIDGLTVNEVITRELEEATKSLSSAVNDDAEATKKSAKAKKEQATELEKVLKTYSDYIAELADEYAQLTLSEREYERYKLSLQGVNGELAESALALYDVVAAQREMAEEAEQAAEDAKRAYEQLGESIQDNLSDAFYNVFQDGTDSIKDLFNNIKNWFFRLLADMAAAALVNPIMLSIGVGGSGALVSGAANAATGGGGLLDGIGSFITQGLGGLLGSGLAGLGGLVGGSFGAGLGIAGGAIADLGIFAGTIEAISSGIGLIGASQTLAGVGTLLGAAVPVIGAVIAIASLFIGKNSVPKATVSGVFDPLTELVEITQDKAKNGASAAPLREIFDSFADQYVDALDILDLGMEQLYTEFHIRDGKLHSLVGPLDNKDAFYSQNVDANDAAAVADVFNQTILAALAQSDTSEATEAVAAFLESITVLSIRDLDQGQAGEVLEWLAQLSTLADDTAQSLPYLADAIRGLGEAGAEIPELMTFTDALVAIGSSLDTTPLEAYQIALERSNRSMLDQLSDAQSSIMQMIADFDGSAASTQQLAQSIVQYKDAATQAAAVIAQMQAAIQSSVDSSIERIRLDVMSQEERGRYFLQQAEQIKQALSEATNPEQIASLFERFEQYTEAAWQTLTDEQKKQQRDIFIDMLQEGGDIANARLDQATEILSQQFEEMANAVTLGMLSAFEAAGLITTGAAEEFRRQIELAASTTVSKLDEMTSFLSAAAEAQGDIMGAALIESSQALLEHLRDGGIDLADALGEAGLTAEEALTLGSVELADRLEEAGVNVDDILTEAGSSAAELLLNAGRELAIAWEDVIDGLDDLVSTLSSATDDLDNITGAPKLPTEGVIISKATMSVLEGVGRIGQTNEPSEELDLDLEQIEAAEKLLMDLTRRLNELQGSGAINAVNDLLTWLDDTLAQAEQLGISADLVNDVFGAELDALLAGLDLDQLNELKSVFPQLAEAIGISIETLIEAAEAAAEELAATLESNLIARLNELQGNGAINALSELTQWLEDTLAQAEELGISAELVNAVFGAELDALLEELDISQLEALRDAFPELADIINEAIDTLIEATESASAELAAALESDLIARLNELQGNGTINALSELTQWLEDTLAQAEELGVSAELVNQVFGEELNALLEGLDLAQLEALKTAFPQFAEIIGETIDELMQEMVNEVEQARLDLEEALNQALNSDIKNSLLDLIAWFQETAASAAELGVDMGLLEDVLSKRFADLLEGLSIGELEELISILPEFGGTLGGLTGELLEAAEAALEAAQQLAKIDEAYAALNVLKIAVDAEKAKLQAEYEAASELIEQQYDAEIERIRAAYEQQRAIIESEQEAQLESMRGSISRVSDALANLRELSSTVSRAIEQLTDPGNDLSLQRNALDRSRAELTTMAILARIGITPNVDALEQVISGITGASRDLFASREDELRVRGVAANQLGEINNLINTRISAQEALLVSLETQLDELIERQDIEIEQLEAQLEAAEAAAESLAQAELDQWHQDQLDALDQLVSDAEAQLNALLGIDTSVLSVAEAIEALHSALDALAVKNKLVIPTAQARPFEEPGPITNTATILQSELIEEIRILRAEVSDQRVENRQLQIAIVKNTQQTAKTLNRWDADDLPATRDVSA